MHEPPSEPRQRLGTAARDAAALAALVGTWVLQAVRRTALAGVSTAHALVSVGTLVVARGARVVRHHAAHLLPLLATGSQRARSAISTAAGRTSDGAAAVGRRAQPLLSDVARASRRAGRRIAAGVATSATALERLARHVGDRAVTRLRTTADELELNRATRSTLGLVALVAGITVLGVAMVTPAVVAADRVLTEARDTIEDVPPLPDDLGTPAQRSRVLAADGSVLAYLAEENRVVVDLDRIPERTRQAVIAIEDVRFYEHDGIDFRALGRAAAANLHEARVAEGGSTITQQYVKNAVLTADRTIDRKLVEAIYSVELERRRSKDEILEGYLNIAYFGNGAYGVAAAAEFYFGVEVDELDLAQSALLAGMIANPTRFDPIDNPQTARQRRDIVLRRMTDAGYVDEAAVAEAIEQPVEVEPHPLPEPTDPFFVEYVKSVLQDDPALGETRQERAQALFTGGLEIQTTLDPSLQDHAEDTIAQHLTDPSEDPLGAIASLDPSTGEIRALGLGPRTFGDCPDNDEDCPETQVNPVVPGMGGSGRQAGSAFKPLVLAAALESGLGTDWDAEADSGTEIEGCGAPGESWEPRNYDRGEPGTIDMVEAVRVSNNVYHAQVISEIGPAAAVETAERLGIQSPLSEVCAIALGAVEVFPLEMASAFGVFANDGVRCEPFVVASVSDAHGETIVEQEPTCEQVLDPQIAATMNSLLRRVIDAGTGTRARIGRDAAGKTGTTDDHRDAWFVGYVPQLVTAAWVGYEVPREMRGILGHATISGGTVPAAMWATFMSDAVADLEPASLSSTGLERYEPDDDDDDGGGGGSDDDGGSDGDGRGPDGEGPPGQRDD